jgi:hypothetical protein
MNADVRAKWRESVAVNLVMAALARRAKNNFFSVALRESGFWFESLVFEACVML